MGNWILSYLSDLFWWVILTVGVILLCGLTVELCARLFSRLIGKGSGAVFDVTAVIGTPVHELGHAAMCLVFGHRIERMRLWSPRSADGVYGFVEHSYNHRNPWARLGNLFIGLGPIFSGLLVLWLMLRLCFPVPWESYLATSRQMLAGAPSFYALLEQSVSLLQGILSAFRTDWIRSLIGLLVMLSVSLHVRLSWQDIRGSASACPLYLLLLAVAALLTRLFGVREQVFLGLRLWSLHALSFFLLIFTFSLLWILLALVGFLLRRLLRLR